jgi:hypothetical protein
LRRRQAVALFNALQLSSGALADASASDLLEKFQR